VLLVPAKADAAGGSYTFSGGSESARATMRNALEASAFDWSLVPEPVTVEIVDCGCAGARPGVIVLDERLLESRPYGRAYTWGVVQHEYAHQFWWLALDDAQRSFHRGKLGALDLCYEQSGTPMALMRVSALRARARGRTGRTPGIQCGRTTPWVDVASGL
jgi:hypothetical protein